VYIWFVLVEQGVMIKHMFKHILSINYERMYNIFLSLSIRLYLSVTVYHLSIVCMGWLVRVKVSYS